MRIMTNMVFSRSSSSTARTVGRILPVYSRLAFPNDLILKLLLLLCVQR
jgi:hypothetical protein